MNTTICLFSQKGGVGKTTTAVNLAAAFALFRKRTLLVDCDPQGAATSIICIIPQNPVLNLSDVFSGTTGIEKTIVQGCLHHLRVIPAPFAASVEERLRLCENGNQLLLKKALSRIKDDFDYVVIDTPASDWPYITNAAAASDFVLLVLRADFLAYRFLGKSINSIKAMKQKLNPALKSGGILLTMYDADDNSSQRIFQSSQKHVGRWLLKTIIPKDPLIGASPLVGKPIVVYDHKSAGAQCYLKLAKELMERLH
jgi:chromosome partitioning protein